MAKKVEGEVVSITPEGNLVTSITPDQLEGAPRDESITIRCDDHKTVGLYPTDHQEAPMTYIAILPEDAPMELTLVGENASLFLGIAVGAKVIIKW